MRRHAFEAIQLSENGNENLLNTFTVTKKRSAEAAYDAAEALCQQARELPHKPAAFVREVNTQETTMDDSYTYLAVLVKRMKADMRAAIGVADELVRDKMLNSSGNLKHALSQLELVEDAVSIRRQSARVVANNAALASSSGQAVLHGSRAVP